MTAQEVIKNFMASLDIQNYSDATSALDDAVRSSSRFDGIQDALDNFFEDIQKAERDAIKTILGSNYKSDYDGMQLSDLLASTDSTLKAALNVQDYYPDEANKLNYGNAKFTATQRIRMLTADTFLKDYCGIELEYYWAINANGNVVSYRHLTGNSDTGAITGADAGGSTVKNSDTVVPEIANKFDASSSTYRQNISTGTNDWVVKATNYGDTITSGGADSIDAGAGFDVVYVTSDNATIKTGENDLSSDTVVVRSNVKVVTISDFEEWDRLNIEGDFTVKSATLDSDTLTVTSTNGRTLNILNWSTAKNAGLVLGTITGGIVTNSQKIGAWLNDFIEYEDTSTGDNISSPGSQPKAITVNLSDVTSTVGSFSVNSNSSSATYSETLSSGNVGTISTEFPDATTFTARGLTVELLGEASNSGGSSMQTKTFSQLTTNEQTVFKGLFKWWIKEGLKLNEESFGLTFSENNTTIANIKVFFYNSSSTSFLANVNPSYDGSGSAVGLTLGINMNYFSKIEEDDENGAGDTLLDRTLAHELNHALVAANVKNFSKLPQFITEGLAELVHGIDDERGHVIFGLAGGTDTSALKSSLSMSSGTGDNNSYAGGYMFLRYFAKQAAAQTSSASALGNSTVTVNLNGNDNTYYSNLTARTETAGTSKSSSNYSVGSAQNHSYAVSPGIKQIIRTSDNGAWQFTEIGNNNTVISGSGADSVTIRGSNDVVTLGAGSNKVSIYGGYDNVVTAGADADSVFVLAASGNSINVGAGNNLVSISGYASSTNWGESKNNTVTAAAGNDSVVLYQSDKNKVNLGTGSNYVTVTGSQNTIQTGEANDNVTFRVVGDESLTSENYVTTGAGADIIDINGQNNTVDAGNGNDNISIHGTRNYAKGGAGSDQINAYTSGNTMSGGAGADEFIVSANALNNVHIEDFSISDNDQLLIYYNATTGSFSGNSITIGTTNIYLDNTDSIADFLDMSIYLQSTKSVTTLKDFLKVDKFNWNTGTYRFAIENSALDVYNDAIYYTQTKTGKTFATVTIDSNTNVTITGYTNGTINITPPSTNYITTTLGSNKFTFNDKVQLKNTSAYKGDFSVKDNKLSFYDSNTIKTLTNTGDNAFTVSLGDNVSINSSASNFYITYSTTTETYTCNSSTGNVQKSSVVYNSNKTVKESIFSSANVKSSDNILAANYVENTHYIENSRSSTVTIYTGTYTFANLGITVNNVNSDGIVFKYSGTATAPSVVGVSNFEEGEAFTVNGKSYIFHDGQILRNGNSTDYYNETDTSKFFVNFLDSDYWGLFTGWKIINGTASYYIQDEFAFSVSGLNKNVTKQDLSFENSTVKVAAAALSTTTVTISDQNYNLALADDVATPQEITTWAISGSRATYSRKYSAGYKVADNKISYSKETSATTLATINGLKLTGVTVTDGAIPGITIDGNFLNVSKDLVGTTAVTFTSSAYVLNVQAETATSILGGSSADTINFSTDLIGYNPFTVSSGEGKDTIYFSNSNLTSSAVIYGGNADDSISVQNIKGTGEIKISGDAGNDTISIGEMEVLFNATGGAGTDIIYIDGASLKGSGVYTISGDAGNDTISAKNISTSAESDTAQWRFQGNAGNDVIILQNISVESGTFTAEGDGTVAGTDKITVDNLNVTGGIIEIRGDNSADTLSVSNVSISSGSLKIYGDNDTITAANSGRDKISVSNVTMSGGSLTISGGAQIDTISVENINATGDVYIKVDGGTENDTITVSNVTVSGGNGEFFGGAGNDFISVENSKDIIIGGGDGKDTITFGANVSATLNDFSTEDTYILKNQITVANFENGVLNLGDVVLNLNGVEDISQYAEKEIIIAGSPVALGELAAGHIFEWTISDTTATYGELITVSGLSTNAKVTDLDLNGNTVTISNGALSTSTAVTISDGYNLELATNVKVSTISDANWKISSGTAIYSAAINAGYIVEENKITYREANTGTALITVTGLNNSAAASQLSVSDTTVTISNGALSTSNTVEISDGYNLALGTNVTLTTISDADWTFSSGTAIYSAAINAGYFVEDNKISYQAAETGTSIITVTGLNNSATSTQLSVSDTTVTISNGALSENNTVEISDGYSLALDTDVTLSKHLDAVWNVSNGTAIYAADVEAGYVLEENKISYRNSETGLPIITINNLSTNATNSDFEVSDTTVTVSNHALSAGNTVTISDGYNLALGTDVTVSTTSNERWNISNGTAIYSANITAGYILSNNQISYQNANNNGAIITISNLSTNAAISDFKLDNKNVTISNHALAASTSKVVTITDGYNLVLNSDVTISTTIDEGWQISNGTGEYKTQYTGAGFVLSENKISYAEQSGGTLVVSVTGLKEDINTKNLVVDTETKTLLVNSPDITEGEISVSSGYILNMGKGGYSDSTIVGGSGVDSIINNGNKLVISTGAGNDLITLSSSASNNTINAGKGNDTISTTRGRNIYQYAEGDGNDVIEGFSTNDTLQITSGSISSWEIDSVNSDLIFTVGTGKVTLKGAAENKVNIANGEEKATAQIYTGEMIYNGTKSAMTLSTGYSENYTLPNSPAMVSLNASTASAIQITGNSRANLIIGNGTISGEEGNDTIYGGNGGDSLSGDSGNDKLFGGAGNDTLNGGRGNNSLTGGEGNDIFIYDGGFDVITDYTENEDKIIIENGTISNVVVANSNTNPKVTFRIGTGYLVINNGAGKKVNINDEVYIYERGRIFNENKTAITLTAAGTVDSALINVDASPLAGTFRYSGNDSDNVISGGRGSDSILGGKGNDTIYGNNGNDRLFGEDGNDILDGGYGNDSLYGGAGNDLIYGGSGVDSLYGGKGNNTLTGGEDADIFVYEGGNDLITDYTENQDRIEIDEEIVNSTVIGSDVILTTASGNITLQNGAGKKITMFDSNNKYTIQIYEKGITYNEKRTAATLDPNYAENYTLPSNPAMVTLDGAAANTIQITGNEKNNVISGNGTISGGKGNDTLTGGQNADSILGGEGSDKLYGNAGDDTLYGGANNDTMTGGDGADVFIYSNGDGNDVIADYAEEDKIVIGSGTISSVTVSIKDVSIKIGTGALTLKDGIGKKITVTDSSGVTSTRIYEKGKIYDGEKTAVTLTAAITETLASSIVNVDGSGSTSSLKLLANSNNNLIQCGKGSDSILGGEGADSIYGNAGSDRLFGENGNDILDGGAGSDFLDGGAGNDSIFGGEGNDTLYGGDGNDTLTGGDGADTFVYERGNDVITDYRAGEDKINFTSRITSTSTSGNDVIFNTVYGTLTVKNAKGQKITVKDYNNKTTTTTYSRTLDLFDSNNFLTDENNLDSITEQKFTVQNIETENNFNLEQEQKYLTFADK